MHKNAFITGKVMKYCNRLDNSLNNYNLVDDEIAFTNQRIVIAVEIYYYLMYYDNKRVNIEVLGAHYKYKEMEEIIAKVFARMLLMPPLEIEKEFLKIYKGEKQGSKGSDSLWYRYLSNMTDVPQEEVVIAWQEARIVLKLLNH